MTEILHSQLPGFLTTEVGEKPDSIYLVHGQEMLVEQSTEQLLEHLLAGAPRDLSCEVVDGLAENIPDILEQVNTFALLSGPKIVVFKEARLFQAQGGHQGLVDQIKQAYESEKMPQAAKSFLNLCSRLKIDLDDVLNESKSNKTLKALNSAVGPEGLVQLTHHCQAKGWSSTASADHVGALLKGIEKGFPTNHYLIITVSARVPKNLKFYKAVKEHGLVVDCNVPLGERRADKTAQEAVLRQTLDKLLAGTGKHLHGSGFAALCQLTGFDMRTFAQNIEKLINYTGERSEITAEDIESVLHRTKNDPIFELTNAVADRNLVKSQFYLDALLRANWHPLQILSALANQTRKLLVAKDFTGSHFGQGWVAGMPYQQFQQKVLPAIQSYDTQIREQAEAWLAETDSTAKNARGKKKSTTDITLAPNPNNPYPVFQTLVKSEKYSRNELTKAMILLNKTDVRLKSTSQDAAMILKATVSSICRPVISDLEIN